MVRIGYVAVIPACAEMTRKLSREERLVNRLIDHV